MAKKAMKIKQARPQKYKTREYNRCKLKMPNFVII